MHQTHRNENGNRQREPREEERYGTYRGRQSGAGGYMQPRYNERDPREGRWYPQTEFEGNRPYEMEGGWPQEEDNPYERHAGFAEQRDYQRGGEYGDYPGRRQQRAQSGHGGREYRGEYRSEYGGGYAGAYGGGHGRGYGGGYGGDYGGEYGGEFGRREPQRWGAAGRYYGGLHEYGGRQQFGGYPQEQGGREFERGGYWPNEGGRHAAEGGGAFAYARGQGARTSHRGRGPRGFTRSDERLQEDINERLMMDHDVDASDIDVAVSNGEVTLSGTVDSKFAKRCAEDCADAVSGVRNVQNNLRVQEEGAPAASAASSSAATGSGSSSSRTSKST